MKIEKDRRCHQTRTPRIRIHPLVATLALGVIFLAAFVAYPIIRSSFDFEISYNEGWNAYHQVAALQGDPYLHFSPYVFTNYTPLSFFLVGLLSRFGDPIIAGRLVSIVSFFVLIGAVGITARKLGVSCAESLFASVLCGGLLGAFHANYIGVNDPQLLGTAVSVLGLMVYAGKPPRTPQNVVALCCFLVAGLIKQTLFVIPIAVTIDLLLRDRREGLRFCAIGILMAMVAVLALYGLFGAGVFAQIFSARQYRIHAAATRTLSYLRETSLCLPLVLFFLGMYIRTGINRLIFIYITVALAVGAFLSGGAGTSSNMFIDVIVALGLATAMIIRCLREDLHTSNGLIAAFIAMSLYSPALQLPYAIERLRDGLSGSLHAAELQFHEDLAFMQNYPGAAYCHSPMLCFRADREFVIDPFNASQAIRLGRLAAAPMLAEFAQGDFAIVQLSTDEEAHSFGPPLNGGEDVEGEFRRILETRYRLAQLSQSRVFYLPR